MFQFARGARILLAMAIRVALIGTGNCGSLALRQLIEDHRFELTDVWVSTPAKVGKDAGELARLDVTTGVLATADLDAVVAAAPDCAVYCAMGDVRPKEAMADVRRLLEAAMGFPVLEAVAKPVRRLLERA